MRKKLILLFFAFVIVIGSCQPRVQQEEVSENENLVIYTGKDTLMPGEESMRMVPVADRVISVPANLEIIEKIRILSDSLSVYYFDGREIKILSLDSLEGTGLVLHLNLVEPSNYEGPGTAPEYRSWYDFFQGSYGGQNTSIILRESFLQPGFDGPWIDAILFYYQGQPIGQWDHLFLDGLVKATR
jgi:hypothetical protein